VCLCLKVGIDWKTPRKLLLDMTTQRLQLTVKGGGFFRCLLRCRRRGNKQAGPPLATASLNSSTLLQGVHYRVPLRPSPVAAAAIDLPIDVQLDPVRAIRAGNQHSLFLHASGRVSALGSDAKGQLRDLHIAEDVQAIGCSWNGSYLQTRMGLLSAGANAHGQLGREAAATAALGPVSIPDTLRVVDFACGSEHVLCVLGQAEVWGWGWNEHGNLATGSLDDVKAPVRIWPSSPAQGEAAGVWAGCGTSWIAVSLPASLHDAG